MTVEELLRRVTSRELSEWMAYYSVEPFGEDRADLRSGIIASLIYNTNRGKDQSPLSPKDFMTIRREDEE